MWLASCIIRSSTGTVLSSALSDAVGDFGVVCSVPAHLPRQLYQGNGTCDGSRAPFAHATVTLEDDPGYPPPYGCVSSLLLSSSS